MRCSEALFNKELFAPSQLTELSVKEFVYLLFSSSHLIVAIILSNNDCEVNNIFREFANIPYLKGFHWFRWTLCRSVNIDTARLHLEVLD
jgi:hypothetical protein